MHLFGQDVLGMVAGEPVAVTTAEGAVGYPARTLEDVERVEAHRSRLCAARLSTQTMKLPPSVSPSCAHSTYYMRARPIGTSLVTLAPMADSEEYDCRNP